MWFHGDKCKSRAIGPQQLLSPKEYTLTLHLMGTAIGGHLLPVQGGLMPRLCHQRWAEIGCDSRLGPEAVSTGQATGDQRAPSRIHHSLQTRGSSCPIGRLLYVSWLGWNRGLPSRGPESIEGLPNGAGTHPTSSSSQQQAASYHSSPFLTPGLPSSPPSASRQAQKPRAVEASWVSRYHWLAPVPTWARHQCPVGERKVVPSQARAPSLIPLGPLCPPTQPNLGPATPPPNLPIGAN